MLFVTLRVKIHFSHVIYVKFFACHTIGHSPIFICQLPIYCVCVTVYTVYNDHWFDIYLIKNTAKTIILCNNITD